MTNGKVHHILEENVDRIFRSVHADFEHRKTGLHEEYQDRTNKHYNRVECVILTLTQCHHGNFSSCPKLRL